MYCGTCIASCPVNVLYHSDEQKPVIKGICILCQLCYYGCPRIELPRRDIENALFSRVRTEEETTIGMVKETYFARTTDKVIRKQCQDAGVASTLLIQAFEDKLIDIAVTTKASSGNTWRPLPSLSFSNSDVLEAAGSKYNVAGSVSGLADAVTGFPDARVGYIGVPCQIEGIRKLTYADYSNRKLGEHIKLAIGIFCYNSFLYKKMMINYLQVQKNINLSEVTKFDIRENLLTVYKDNEKIFEVAVSDLKDFKLPGCSKCQDFTGELANVSVGSIDSPVGWSTVLVRTETGSKLFENAITKDKIEVKPLKNLQTSLKNMIKLAEKKKLRPAPYLKI